LGPDFFSPVTDDYELECESEFYDKLSPQQLDHLAAKLGRLVERTSYERGDPDEWDEENTGEFTRNIAHVIALRILLGWLKCKSLSHRSMNRKAVKEARSHEDIWYTHIKNLLRIKRGEKPGEA
jgi:hypothetical protein